MNLVISAPYSDTSSENCSPGDSRLYSVPPRVRRADVRAVNMNALNGFSVNVPNHVRGACSISTLDRCAQRRERARRQAGHFRQRVWSSSSYDDLSSLDLTMWFPEMRPARPVSVTGTLLWQLDDMSHSPLIGVRNLRPEPIALAATFTTLRTSCSLALRPLEGMGRRGRRVTGVTCALDIKFAASPPSECTTGRERGLSPPTRVKGR